MHTDNKSIENGWHQTEKQSCNFAAIWNILCDNVDPNQIEKTMRPYFKYMHFTFKVWALKHCPFAGSLVTDYLNIVCCDEMNAILVNFRIDNDIVQIWCSNEKKIKFEEKKT